MEALDWLYLANLEVPSGALGVAEMRDGPAADVILVRLKPGFYRPCVGSDPEGEAPGAIASFRALHESALGGWRGRRGPNDVERGGVLGWVSTDVATAGFFDYELLSTFAGRDADAFEAWRAGFFARMQFPHGFCHYGGDGRVPLVYVQSSEGGGHFPVSELILDGEPVGLEVAFSPAIVDVIDVSRELRTERITNPEPLVLQGA